MRKIHIRKILKIFLWLIAVHTLLVGICLIFVPESYMLFFGFEIHQGNFFRAQGGIFHLIMCVVYIMTSQYFEKSTELILITVSAKMIATIFLFAYFFLINPIWTVLLSGIGDFLMGAIVWRLYILYKLQNKTL